MKRFILILALCATSVPALAQHGHYRPYHHHHRHYSGGGWVAPLILGGVVGYAITRNNEPAVVQPAPVIVQPQALPQANPYCGPWVEVQQPDGTIVRQRTCTQ